LKIVCCLLLVVATRVPLLAQKKNESFQLFIKKAVSPVIIDGIADEPAWRQSDFDLVKSAEFRDFLKAQKFTLVSWRELARTKSRTAG